MEVHENPVVLDTVFCILNDDGTRCGLTQEQRRKAAEKGLAPFEQACTTYSNYRAIRYKARQLTTEEVRRAATILQSHYQAGSEP